MNLKVNRFLLTQTKWDSGTITPLASVMHSFRETGQYRILLLAAEKEERIGVIDLLIDDKAPEKPMSIDVDAISKENISQTGTPKSLVGHPQKPISFYVSRGSQSFFITAYKLEKGRETKVFDSRELQNEDVFMVNPLVSGRYSITSNHGKGEMVIHKRKDRSLPSQGLLIECTEEGFKPGKVETDFLQPVFFMIKTKKPSRIKIQLENQQESGKKRARPQKLKKKK